MEPVQMKCKDITALREELLIKQNGKCLICSKQIQDPCLDHSHKKRNKGTGLIRGVLCRTCNIFIAKSENNCVRYGIPTCDLPQILRACAIYLEREHLPLIHPSEREKEPLLKKTSYKKLVKHLKIAGYTKKIPQYPKSQKMTVALQKLYDLVSDFVVPEYYK